jgi:UDP-glucose-4-epimerase GalE
MEAISRTSILVTGGAGYIGSHCCKVLFEAGYLPVCYDNLSTGHRSHVKWGPLVEGDIADTVRVTDTLRQHKISAVMHFAASSLVGESVIDPQAYYRNNLVGTLALLEAMRRTNCMKIVFSSTGAVYGSGDTLPIPEDYPLAPINPYGASKLMVERVLSDFRTAYGLSAFCLRYFNASGADPSGEIGELHEPETHLIPRAMMALLDPAASFAVFGTDYPTPDGTAIRDYIHVLDLAAAHLLALQLLLDGHAGETFNLGTGTGCSVKEILAAIGKEAGIEVPFMLKDRRSGDPAFLVADASKAKNLLKFRPAYSDLATIVKTAWAWHSLGRGMRAGI